MQATPGLAKSLCLRAKRIIGESTERGAQARQPLRRPPEDSSCPLGVTGVRADPPAVAPDLIGVCAACWTETSLVSQLVLDPVRSKLAGRHGPGAFETLPHMSVPRLLFR